IEPRILSPSLGIAASNGTTRSSCSMRRSNLTTPSATETFSTLASGVLSAAAAVPVHLPSFDSILTSQDAPWNGSVIFDEPDGAAGLSSAAGGAPAGTSSSPAIRAPSVRPRSDSFARRGERGTVSRPPLLYESRAAGTRTGAPAVTEGTTPAAPTFSVRNRP